jgi:GST-like protein
MAPNRIYPSRWPIEHPDRLQLYTLNTPNGQKVGIALEELGVPYEAHRIDFGKDDQHDPEYLLINPNNKIPTLVDPAGPDGTPLVVFESGAILMYLADKTGKLISPDPRLRWETVQWLMFQMGGVGPFFGQFGHFFKFARDKTSDDYGVRRYTAETKRLLKVLDLRLEGRDYLVGDEISIADIATVPWIDALDFYGGKDHLEYRSYANIVAWVERCNERPAFQRGSQVGAKPS